jgi:hypothetical protein
MISMNLWCTNTLYFGAVSVSSVLLLLYFCELLACYILAVWKPKLWMLELDWYVNSYSITILYCLFVTCTKKHADHAIPFPTEWGKLWTSKDCFYTSFPSWQVTIKINPYMLLLLLQYIYILWQTAMSDMRVGVHASYLTICKTLLNDISTRGGKSVSEDF